MRFLLRLIAVLQGIAGLLLVPMACLAAANALPDSARGRVALALVAVAAPLGLFSGVQLFRLRESGRIAALGFIALLVVFGMVQFRSPAALTLGNVVKFGIWVAFAAALSSGRARQLCRKAPRAAEEPESVRPDGLRRDK